jgi:hypothetical protein
MKYKVTYYDYDSDKYLTKDLYWMASHKGSFDFVPIVDGPKENWKGVSLYGCEISMVCNDKGVTITVEGFQQKNGGGYCKTITVAKSVIED